MKFTALELILHLAEGSTTPNTLQHIAKIARDTLDAPKEQEALQPYKDMANADYLRGHREGRKLAQTEQTPEIVANMLVEDGRISFAAKRLPDGDYGLYTTPPKHLWVGLTDKEAMQICVDCGCMSEDWLTLLDAIEAKLKEKNT